MECWTVFIHQNLNIDRSLWLQYYRARTSNRTEDKFKGVQRHIRMCTSVNFSGQWLQRWDRNFAYAAQRSCLEKCGDEGAALWDEGAEVKDRLSVTCQAQVEVRASDALPRTPNLPPISLTNKWLQPLHMEFIWKINNFGWRKYEIFYMWWGTLFDRKLLLQKCKQQSQ